MSRVEIPENPVGTFPPETGQAPQENNQICPIRANHERLEVMMDLSDLRPQARNPLWQVQRYWTIADEDDYSDWFSSLPKNFLHDTGLKVDCADFAIAARWIYSRDHNLPAAQWDTSNQQLFGHFSSRPDWDILPTAFSWREDQRFLAALKYILDNAYTHSLASDMYPVSLSTEFVKPGTTLLSLWNWDTGHTMPIRSVDASCSGVYGCMETLWGTEPASEEVFSSGVWITNPGSPSGGGFMRFRWPVQTESGRWILTPARAMPGYSLEQYVPELNYYEYIDFVYAKLGFSTSTKTKYVTAAQDFRNAILRRVDIVASGFLMCNVLDCGGKEELYSTPSRDRRTRNFAAEAFKWGLELPYNDETHQTVFRILNVPLYTFSVPYDTLPGLSGWDYYNDRDKILTKMVSDPKSDVAERWGIENATNLQKLDFWTQAFQSVWKDRESLVIQARQRCYPDGVNLVCDPNSDVIKNLATTIVDSGLKKIQRRMFDVFKGLPDQQRVFFLETFGKRELGEDLCRQSTCRFCSIKNVLFTESSIIQNMKSNASSPPLSRYGMF